VSLRDTLRHDADLVHVLVVRDVRLRYRRSVLGMAWSQLAPLAQVAILAFVFSRVVRLGIPDYPVFLFVGLLPWLWFSDSVVGSTGSVIAHRDLVRKPMFPVAMVPVVTIATQLVYFVFAIPALLLAVVIATGRIPLTVIALPAILAAQFLICLGPCYVLAAVNIRFRDMTHLIAIVVALLFYATPILYTRSSVPSRYDVLYALNPLAHLIDAYRTVFLAGRWPDFGTLALLCLIGAAGAWLGSAIYRALEYQFYDEL
jgi:lipopolysaccharide transport system permease protein